MVGPGEKSQASAASASRRAKLCPVKRKGPGENARDSETPQLPSGSLRPTKKERAKKERAKKERAKKERVIAQRKQFQEAVALYSSAIVDVERIDLYMGAFELEEVCDMVKEVGGALTTLQTQLINLQNDFGQCRKGVFDVVMAKLLRSEKREKRAQETIQASLTADRVRAEAEKADRVRFEAEKAQAGEEAKACHICMEKPHDVVIFPCLHAHFCYDCLEKHKTTNNTCPTCRTTIVSTLRYRL